MVSAIQPQPYYIVAPRYVATSAGVRVLHTLCHMLNAHGQQAFVVTFPDFGNAAWVSPDLNTPVLDMATARAHAAAGRKPIVVYPETVRRPFFKGGLMVRYALNLPGLLGGPARLDDAPLCLSYGARMLPYLPADSDVLYIPVCDPEVFTPPPAAQKRHGFLAYAGKYVAYHQQTIPEAIRAKSTLITRDLPDSHTQAEMVALMQGAEALYVFENTSLISEALLCGCPVICVKNPYFDMVLAEAEHGNAGITWTDTPAALAEATARVGQFRADYRAAQARSHTALAQFIARSQSMADSCAPLDVASLLHYRLQSTRDWFGTRARAIWAMARQQGLPTATGHVLRALKRRLNRV